MAQLALINPSRRKAKRKSKRAKARKNPVRALSPTKAARGMFNPKKRRTSRRRNPAGRGGNLAGMMKNNVLPAVTAAGGALGLDIVWGMLPLPEQIKAGPMRHIAKAAGALAIGFVARNVVKRETANLMTLGMLTTITHSAMREAVTKFAPQLALGMVNDELAAIDSEYMSAITADEMGYFSPTPVADNVGAYDNDLSAVTFDY